MKKIILTIAVLAGIITACEQESIPTFDTKDGINDRIYFSYADKEITSYIIDSVFVRFGYDIVEKSDSVYTMEVKILGGVADYDRPVAIGYIDEITTARQGVDVELLPDLCFVPAGKIYGNVAIRLKNTDYLKDKVLKVGLRLLDNEYFKTDYTRSYYQSSLKDTIITTQFKVLFDNAGDMPIFWANPTYAVRFNMMFGTYSNKKFRLICELFDIDRDYFTYDPSLTASEITSLWNVRFPMAILMGWAKAFNLYLTTYKLMHNGEAILEDDGTEMTGGQYY